MPSERFSLFIEPHLGTAYTLARWLCGNKFDADDIYQEAVEIAYREVGQLRTSNGKAWLLTIVRNCFNQKLRSSKVEVVDLEAISETGSDLEPADEVLIRQANETLIHRSLEELAVEYRE